MLPNCRLFRDVYIGEGCDDGGDGGGCENGGNGGSGNDGGEYSSGCNGDVVCDIVCDIWGVKKE